MNESDQIKLELEKNRADEFVVKKELETAKQDFINALNKGVGKEIKTFDLRTYNTPNKHNKSCKDKIRSFFNKLFKIVGL